MLESFPTKIVFSNIIEKTYLSQTELKKTNTIRQYVKFNKLLKQANYYFPTFVTSETLNTKEHESKSCI